jgi:hypothetical protein
MVLIPPDAAIRMRMQTEAELLQPTQPVRGIPADLPALQRGQTFTAQIREVLPDNTYRALVAGKQLTLQLTEGAKAGDELELVVLDRSGKVIIARQVDAGNTQTAGSAAPYPFAKFSPAAQLIGRLLPSEGEATPPASLNRGQPLLAQPPQAQNAAATLAPALGKAVAQSGMFYEAHQAQWVSGKLPLVELLQEPQGQKSMPVALQLAAAEIAAKAISTPERPITAQAVIQALQGNPIKTAIPEISQPAPQVLTNTAEASPPEPQTEMIAAFRKAIAEIGNHTPASSGRLNLPNTPPPVQQGRVDTGASLTTIISSSSPQPLPSALLSQQIPDDLRPLVQQQLEAAATNRMVWHGEVWPRQSMDWEIEWSSEREADGSSAEEARWRTALSLTTPRLGRVDAKLQLSANGVRVVLATPSDSSANDLRSAAPALAEALAAAGVPLLDLKVKFENEYPAGQG